MDRNKYLETVDHTGFGNLNLLTFRLTIFFIPAEYVIEIWDGTVSAVPATFMLGTTSVAIFSIITGPNLRMNRRRSMASLGAVLWFMGLAGFIVFLSRTTLISQNAVLCWYGIESVLGIIGTVLVRRVWQEFAVSRLPLSLAGAVLTPFVFLMIPYDLLHQATRYLPKVYDGPLYRIGAMFGYQILPWFGNVLRNNPSLNAVERSIYLYLFIWMALASYLQQRRCPPSRAFLNLTFLILQFAGFGLYILMPAVGPSPFFGNLFPNALPVATSVTASVSGTSSDAFRNAMPSLHASSALLCFLAVRECSIWQRVFAGLIVLSIFVSTLGFGEHYVVDWVAAFPLVLFVRGVAAVYLPIFGSARRNAIAAGVFLELLWVLIVRGAPYSLEIPDLIRAFALASLIVPVILERRLAAVERIGTEAEADQRTKLSATRAGRLIRVTDRTRTLVDASPTHGPCEE